MNDFVTFLQDCLKGIKEQAERDQQRWNDPCWRLEWVYTVAPQVAKLLAEGTIQEKDIWQFAIDMRQVWVNDCEEPAVS